MPRAGLPLNGDILNAACGGAPPTSETSDPCGSSARPNVGEDDACRQPPPCKSPSTLRLGGVGTNDNIQHVVSGGIHPDTLSGDPCGRSVLDRDRGCDAWRLPLHDKPPLTLCLRCTCTNDNILHAVSGGSPLSPLSGDPCDRPALTDDSCGLPSLGTQAPPLEFPPSADTLASAGCGSSTGCGELHHPLSPPKPSTCTAFIRHPCLRSQV